MNCHNAYPATNDCKTKYAPIDTTRWAPAKDRTKLYLLSFLLTADREKAERCFVAGLELAAEDQAALRDWAHSWARRVVIDNALRLIAPHPHKGKRGADFRRPG
jgi:hypothetical protein